MRKSIPLLTFGFIDWLEEQDTKEKIIIEFGSGESTLYFSRKFKKVITYEDEVEWVNLIKSKGIDNVIVNYLDYNFYKKEPNYFIDADFILIDNNPRNKNLRLYVAENLIESINYKNIIILDNSDWNPDCYFYLRSKYKSFKDFIGLNYKSENTVTSVFYDRAQ